MIKPPQHRIKGVILAAGYGTRFLPVTKTIPKEMLPLVNIPSIQFIIDEFTAAGIRDILIITSRRKKSLEDYFDREPELENVIQRSNDREHLPQIAPQTATIFFTRQTEMLGTAHALSLGEPFTGDTPFVVAYPDDILLSDPTITQNLIETWQQSCCSIRPEGCSVLSILELPPTLDVSRYGVVDIEQRNGQTFAKKIIEKPLPGTEPSRQISLGRYLFTRELYPVIRDLVNLPRQSEFYQTEPINVLAVQGKVMCVRFQGTYYDIGKPLGYLKAIVDIALNRNDLGGDFRTFLRERLSK